MKISQLTKYIGLSAGACLMVACSEATNDVAKADIKQASVEKSQPAPATSTDTGVSAKVDAEIRQAITTHLGPAPISKIMPSNMPGFYVVAVQSQLIYISDDYKYLFPGPLLAVEEGKLVNLSRATQAQIEKEREPERAKLLAGVEESNMVVFKAPEEKYVVNIFTDVDCPYCRKLHQEMDGYLSRGITVRYLAFPRAGVGSSAYNKLVSIWCADDKASAMDDAKLSNKFDPKECTNPVSDQYHLTRQLGLTGTPAIISEDGFLISGFLEPEKLLNALEQNKQG
ncbi:thioredoxin fold domain-containing protein [Pleionea sp. CnH1-48]|uniref:thioredoxin fold domain-containing protein n=1 Tax=Pleionea sp. CnH1-48 TaxID=2954494 RepID=UPI002097E2DE|nr:thioredoxin fold domain-containing protein [Pleionea sp. CnH1-48]MCO7225514.1 thioredoxin fold domain-containing protein [Pleionea sp. CnH1-48]